MQHLIYKVGGNKYVNHSFFRPYLYIYDDMVLYTKRHHMLWVDEISVSYKQIVQVNLYRGLLFSKMEIQTSGREGSIHIKGLWNRQAKRAKRIIDQKIYHAHHKTDVQGTDLYHTMERFEKNISRLFELLNQGKLTKREFENKKAELLKHLH